MRVSIGESPPTLETDALPTELRSCVVKLGRNCIKLRLLCQRNLSSGGEMAVKLLDFIGLFQWAFIQPPRNYLKPNSNYEPVNHLENESTKL